MLEYANVALVINALICKFPDYKSQQSQVKKNVFYSLVKPPLKTFRI